MRRARDSGSALMHPPRLSELSAPDWLVQLVKPKRVPVPWPSVVRAVLAVGLPVIVGEAAGNLPTGILMALGALSGAIGDRRGPYRLRVAQIGLNGVGGSLGFLVGELVHGHGWVTVASLVVVAVICAIVSVIGTIPSTAALQALIYVVVASAQTFPPPLWRPPLLYVCGAGWVLVLATLGLLLDAVSPERRLVAQALRSLASLADAIGTPDAEDARRALTDALNKAYDALLSGRVRAGGRNSAFRRFMAILNRVTPVVEATVAAMQDRRRLPADVPIVLRELADALVERRRPAPLRPLDASAHVVLGTEPATAALRNLVALVAGDRPDGEFPEGPMRQVVHRTLGDRVRAAVDRVITGRTTWFFAVRLALCIGLAEVYVQLVDENRSYWVALTVAIVLKPDFGSVFARAVQRGIGTVLGVLLGAGILVVVPRGGPLIACVVVLAALLPAVVQRHYGIFAVFLTPLVILLLDMLDSDPAELLKARLIDTIVGCAIVLVFGYLLWPETFKNRVGRNFTVAVDALASYTRTALVPGRPDRGARRRNAYRRLSDLRTVFQQALAEPPPVSSRASAWWPAIVAMERLADAVTAGAIALDRGAEPPDPDDVDRLADAVQELADATREGRSVDSTPLPDRHTQVLSDAVVEVGTARSVLTGPR